MKEAGLMIRCMDLAKSNGQMVPIMRGNLDMDERMVKGSFKWQTVMFMKVNSKIIVCMDLVD